MTHHLTSLQSCALSQIPDCANNPGCANKGGSNYPGSTLFLEPFKLKIIVKISILNVFYLKKYLSRAAVVVVLYLTGYYVESYNTLVFDSLTFF